MTRRIIRKAELKRLTGLGDTAIDVRVKDGRLPPSFSLGGGRAVGWWGDEVEAAIEHWGSRERATA